MKRNGLLCCITLLALFWITSCTKPAPERLGSPPTLARHPPSNESGTAQRSAGVTEQVPERLPWESTGGLVNEPPSSVPGAGSEPAPESPIALPPEWPEDIPIMDGFSLTGVLNNPAGGITAMFQGKASSAEVDSFYKSRMTGWTSVEPPPEPAIFSDMLKLNFVKDQNTAYIVAATPDPSGNLSLTIYYNWYTLPGRLPAGWPDTVQVMPGLEVKDGTIEATGDMTVNAVGTPSLNEIGTFYKNDLSDWTRIEPQGTPDVQMDRLMITLERGGKRLVVSGFTLNEKSVLVLIYGNAQTETGRGE